MFGSSSFRAQIADVTEMILHTLLQFVYLVIEYLLEFSRVDLWLYVTVAHCSTLALNLLDRIDWLSVLSANQTCLREILTWARHLHSGELLLLETTDRALVVNVIDVRRNSCELRNLGLGSWPWDFSSFLIDAHQDFLVQQNLLLKQIFGLESSGLVTTPIATIDLLAGLMLSIRNCKSWAI